jgi:SAM-dependent methyltransferase
METTEYSFIRYLAAKTTVDDRAINRHVWDSLKENLPQSSPDKPLNVLEIGAGFGTMLARAVDWGLLKHALYTALDFQAENIDKAYQHIPVWAGSRGWQYELTSSNSIVIHHRSESIHVQLIAEDVFTFVNHQTRQWDLLIAHAFLDLLDIPTALPVLLNVLKPGGLCYFSLNFDGATIFEPTIDPPFDQQVETLYHQTMDQRLTRGEPSGDSKTGRHLFTHLKKAGIEILASGASDWVVFPVQGSYPHDEAYFLHFIINTIQAALIANQELDAQRFASWIETRHTQVNRGELVYIAHQIDFVGRKEGSIGHT